MAWRLACVHVLLQMHALTLVSSPRVVFVVRVVQREERVFRTKYCYQDISGEGRGKKQATFPIEPQPCPQCADMKRILK